MKKGILWALSLLLLILVLPVSAEVLLSCVPENPAVGDTIDVTVSAGPGAVSVIYTLTANGKTVFSGKEDPHFVAAFRPRQEADYELRAAVVYADGTRETAETFLTVSGMAEEQADSGIIYNQKDGWWKNKSYAKSTMDQSGCAIFALSHALQRMGYTGSDVLPEAMGIAYANCLSVDGTRNGRLITQASEVYHFVTQEDLLERVSDIADGLKNGDMYSFGIVIGHIALADGISENGKMVHVTDSAPSATFERIKNASLYYQNEQGQFIAAKSLEEMPGFRWFFETSSCGGLEYYLEIGYTARRGLRLIRPPWLFRKGSGEPEPVTLVYPGTAVTTIESAGEKEEIPSAELEWETNALSRESSQSRD